MQVQNYYERNSNICDVLSRNCVVHLKRKIAGIFCVTQTQRCRTQRPVRTFETVRRVEEAAERTPRKIEMFCDVTSC